MMNKIICNVNKPAAMMENNAEILREWTPMTELINQIPVKVQNGLFPKLISLTCVDVIPEFLTLGTNIGVIYWYNRKNADLQTLRCEAQEVTCIKIVNTVDYMVAAGHQNGQITIFQIPKSHPDCLPESLRPKNARKIEQYTITEVHSNAITSLEWSTNGMKLYSGDKNGLVVLSELDFSMHICREFTVVNESYEIVQLCYCQQQLLVSTTYRSIICQYNKQENKWKVCQVGKKDRKSLGPFGGLFWKTGLKPTDVIAYCCRPGLRIWVADTNGAVQKTLLFKDLVTTDVPEIPLLNPISINVRMLKPIENERSFGALLAFADKYLITQDSCGVYILDPENLVVVGMVREIRSVVSLACTKDEIFILEGGRSLIRLAPYPELPTNVPPATPFLPISDSLKDLTSKFNSSSIISALPTFLDANVTECSIQTDNTAIVNAEEAQESPHTDADMNFYEAFQPHGINVTNLTQKLITNSQNIAQIVVDLIHPHSPYDRSMYVSEFESPRHVPYVNELPETSEETMRKLQVYEKIGQQPYDSNILYKRHRRKASKKRTGFGPEMDTSVTSSCGSEVGNSDTEDSPKASPLKINLPDDAVDFILQPDLRSPDSIKNDIQEKEKLLSEILFYRRTPSPVQVDVVPVETYYRPRQMRTRQVQNGRQKSKTSPVVDETTNGAPAWNERKPPEKTSPLMFAQRLKQNGSSCSNNVTVDDEFVVPSTSFDEKCGTDFENSARRNMKYGRNIYSSQDNADSSDMSLTDWEII